jgi:hypothetical protein
MTITLAIVIGIISFFSGSFMGLMVAGLMIAAGNADRRVEENERSKEIR